MYNKWLAALALVCGGTMNALAADELTAYVFPLDNRDALAAAYFTPFTEATGINVKDAMYDGTDERFMQRLKSGKATWDLVQVESLTLERGCREGWFQKIDLSKIGDKADFVPGSLSECGVGIFGWSHAMVYRPDKVNGAPASWADFWDVKKFPGKRGLRRSAKYTLEIALLADGVAPADVYKVLASKEGVDRAFRKLGQIKDDVIWWQAAPQPTLFLEGDKMVMSSAYTLWVAEDKRAAKFKIVWNGSLHDFDSWVIPKGAKRTEDAYKFIAFASKPANQKRFSTELAYGPTNRKTLAMLDPKVVAMLPTSEGNLKGAIRIDTAFWDKHGVELEHRFADWLPPLPASADEQEEEHHGKKQPRSAPHSH